jgi:uncharacterized protein (DUF885 family)
MIKRYGSMLVLSVITLTTAKGSFGMSAPDDFEKEYLTILQNREDAPDSVRLQQFFELSWTNNMAEHPEWASNIGYDGYSDRWTDRSFEAIDVRKETSRLQARVMGSIDREQLSETDQVSYDLFDRDLRFELEGQKYRRELMPINQMGGIQQNLASTLSMMPANTTAQCENILARLNAVPIVVDQTLTLLDSGLALGITPPRVTLTEVTQQIQNQIVDDPADAPLLEFLKNMSDEIDSAGRESIHRQASATYKDKIIPAFTKLHDFFEQTYLPGCREAVAWSELPDGREWYDFLVRQYTTTSLTPDEIFNIGHSEVKRIRQEMDRVISKSGFEGDFAAFCEFLRTDEQFFFDSAEDLLREYRDISKRVDPELVKLFGKLPRLPYGVTPIPSYAEKSQTTAYYQPGSNRAGRPGYFYANTYDLKSRPRWEMEALTLHEAVPGHHLQISLAQELENVPEFRSHSWITAYGEGWALYAESLGEEMGFYADPYSKFGQLTYEMWRAIRLVVDVGIHVKGWSRQRAIDFFTENSSKTQHDIEVEIDRYIVWPGQALAYKIGELRIKELRAFAEERLGESLDIRAFHDELLGHGSLPLDLLESRMREWVETQGGL